jgi:GntR family transcriptional regulator
VIEFRVDRADGLPAYLQLERQVREALRLGWLHPGDRLPTVREVVASAGVNANTVLKAYRELEVAGLVEARQGSGTFVTGSLGSADPAAMAELWVGLARWVHTAKEAGLDNEDIRAVLGAVLAERGNVPTEGVQ